MVIGVKSFICTYFLHEPNNCEKCQIDIKSDSTDENPAHSRIIMIPNVNKVPSDMQKGLRQKFRENLALIANQLGWSIEPAF